MAADREQRPAPADPSDRPTSSGNRGTPAKDDQGLSSAGPGAARTTQGVDRMEAEDEAREDAERRFAPGGGPEDRVEPDRLEG